METFLLKYTYKKLKKGDIMDKNSINTSPDIVSKAPSTRRETRGGGASIIEYFRGKKRQNGSVKGGKNNKVVKKGLYKKDEKPKEVDDVNKVERKKPHRLEWLKEYISFVHCNSAAPVVKQALFHAGITPDLCIYSDCYDSCEQEIHRKYDPRYNDDVKEL